MKYFPPRYLFRRHEIMRIVQKGESFLEIGPGNLELALELSTLFEKGTLIDFNTSEVPHLYETLSEINKEKIKIIIADFSQYNQFESKFDCVVACEVLEHIEDDWSFLRQTNDLLVNDGQLILSVPARQKFWSLHDEIVGHYRRYEKQELWEKLADAGYSQIKIVSYGYPFQNLIRYARIAYALFQYRQKVNWDKKKQTQQSAFMANRKSYINLIGLILNKYTLYPFCLVASLFNNMNLGEGYVVSAIKETA